MTLIFERDPDLVCQISRPKVIQFKNIVHLPGHIDSRHTHRRPVCSTWTTELVCEKSLASYRLGRTQESVGRSLHETTSSRLLDYRHAYITVDVVPPCVCLGQECTKPRGHDDKATVRVSANFISPTTSMFLLPYCLFIRRL